MSLFLNRIFLSNHLTLNHKSYKFFTPGVLRFLYWLGQPAQVRQVEIDAIRSFLGENQSVESISFDVGLKLNVKQGVLKGSEGVVVYQTKNEVVLKIEKLGMSLVARLPKVSVESISL